MIRYPSSHINTRALADDRGLVIEVSGYFNMGVQGEFRRAYSTHATMTRYLVDLKHCEGIDSAGLGMLLLLRDFAQLPREKLVILHCPPAIERVLNYSHFDQIFTLAS